MARVSVKMQIEKYEAHWTQATCPSDTEIRRYRHQASSSKVARMAFEQSCKRKIQKIHHGEISHLESQDGSGVCKNGN